MTQFYSDPRRASLPYSLPDCEVFHRTRAENKEYGCTDSDGIPMPAGWYYWYCFPGCMPEGDPMGPYSSERAAIRAAISDAGD